MLTDVVGLFELGYEILSAPERRFRPDDETIGLVASCASGVNSVQLYFRLSCDMAASTDAHS
ncbi:MAG: hypothetical protein KIT18_03365 [Burkholderiales bacterium]|nr:hypothetical protein [Burkholderiales bacterium]